MPTPRFGGQERPSATSRLSASVSVPLWRDGDPAVLDCVGQLLDILGTLDDHVA